MTPYPTYKNSGVPWLGEVPEHWVMKPGLAIFREKQIKNIGLIENRVLSLSYGKIIIKPEEKLRGLVPESFETYQIVEPGDIIIRSTDMQNDHTSLRTGLVNNRGIITSAYICLNSLCQEHSKFNHWQLHGLDLMKVFYGLGSGLRQNLSWKDFKRLQLPVPTPEEQHHIARYLDWQTSRINTFIKAKKKLIALLKEQKQVIINEAVTKGINPDVNMKDSGVEWLGEIPEHWEVSKNKGVYSERRESGSDELPILSVSIHHGVSTEEQNEKENLRVKIRIQDRKKYLRVYPNDIAFNMMRAWQGGIGVVRVHGMVSPAYIVAKPKKEINSRFVEFLFRTPQYIQEMNRNSRGITDFRKRLYWDQYKNISIVIPPIEEQQSIVDFIEQETTLIDQTIARTEREIELIREYRTRLVSDVVTGKIDVRSVTIPDFDPVDETADEPDDTLVDDPMDEEEAP